jgi:L-ascorbate metabolism protein UlaG (beta-lactamase superfamily)
MRLTKYGHSCLLVEEGPARLLLDPGTLSGGFEELEGLTAVLVTHQHADHLDLQRLRTLLDRNPGARVLCDEGSAEQLAAAGAAVEVVHDGEELDVGGVAVRVAGATTRSSTPTSRWSPTSATWWAGGCSIRATHSPRRAGRSRCWRSRPGRRG